MQTERFSVFPCLAIPVWRRREKTFSVLRFLLPAAYMTANTVLEILHITPISLRAEDGEMLFRVSDTDARTCRSLFEGFKLHLLGLEEQYPENLQVRYAEV